ncbi:MAG TPA: V-type ATP synthase subunit F [Planctomycetota bacterium]|nr:V-type ATP synthase subunit F [Planctomycetota bacterium]
MKYHVIADEDTVLGFHYAGIEGTVVESPEQARRVFREKVADAAVGIIIMTERAAETVGGEVQQIMYQSARPVIVQIPGPEGPLPSRRSLQQLIQEAVGIKL